jgi:uncharacterized membrane protein
MTATHLHLNVEHVVFAISWLALLLYLINELRVLNITEILASEGRGKKETR